MTLDDIKIALEKHAEEMAVLKAKHAQAIALIEKYAKEPIVCVCGQKPAQDFLMAQANAEVAPKIPLEQFPVDVSVI
jgi:hypothetical protein